MKKTYLLFAIFTAIYLFPAADLIRKPLQSYEHEWFETLLQFQSPTQTFIPCQFRDSLQKNFSPTPESFFKDPSISIIEELFDAFCQKMAKPSFADTRISPIVHFIWLGSPLPPRAQAAVESWKKHNPSWEFRVWSDNDIASFPWSSSRSQYLYEHANNWAEKSDILRFEILYQFGGVYSDTDVICFKSFDDLIRSGITFFAGIEYNEINPIFKRPLIASAIIGAAKGSIVIKRSLELSKSAEEAPDVKQYMRSGPGPLSHACHEILLSPNSENLLILPCSYFYSLPWKKRLSSAEEILEYINPESFAVHLWEGSWL